MHFTRRFSCALSSLHPRLYLCDRHRNSHEGQMTGQQVGLLEEGLKIRLVLCYILLIVSNALINLYFPTLFKTQSLFIHTKDIKKKNH